VVGSRYDGQTEWYDECARGDVFTELRRRVVDLLGPPSGRCLDLGCGTGLTVPLLRERGWHVVGVDVSATQLARARERLGAEAELIAADAHALPFGDGSLDAVVSVLTHTDLDDLNRVFAEIYRVLRPGGVLVYAGVHPAFASPNVEPQEDGTWLVRTGYRREGWQTVSRDPDKPGVRSRVGINHTTLASLLNALITAGFAPQLFDEPGSRDPPLFLAFRAAKA
jgi:ubiquinone/menaquinone biosynthesis C-methylase UbiE